MERVAIECLHRANLLHCNFTENETLHTCENNICTRNNCFDCISHAEPASYVNREHCDNCDMCCNTNNINNNNKYKQKNNSEINSNHKEMPLPLPEPSQSLLSSQAALIKTNLNKPCTIISHENSLRNATKEQNTSSESISNHLLPAMSEELNNNKLPCGMSAYGLLYELSCTNSFEVQLLFQAIMRVHLCVHAQKKENLRKIHVMQKLEPRCKINISYCTNYAHDNKCEHCDTEYSDTTTRTTTGEEKETIAGAAACNLQSSEQSSKEMPSALSTFPHEEVALLATTTTTTSSSLSSQTIPSLPTLPSCDNNNNNNGNNNNTNSNDNHHHQRLNEQNQLVSNDAEVSPSTCCVMTNTIIVKPHVKSKHTKRKSNCVKQLLRNIYQMCKRIVKKERTLNFKLLPIFLPPLSSLFTPSLTMKVFSSGKTSHALSYLSSEYSALHTHNHLPMINTQSKLVFAETTLYLEQISQEMNRTLHVTPQEPYYTEMPSSAMTPALHDVMQRRALTEHSEHNMNMYDARDESHDPEQKFASSSLTAQQCCNSSNNHPEHELQPLQQQRQLREEQEEELEQEEQEKKEYYRINEKRFKSEPAMYNQFSAHQQSTSTHIHREPITPLSSVFSHRTLTAHSASHYSTSLSYVSSIHNSKISEMCHNRNITVNKDDNKNMRNNTLYECHSNTSSKLSRSSDAIVRTKQPSVANNSISSSVWTAHIIRERLSNKFEEQQEQKQSSSIQQEEEEMVMMKTRPELTLNMENSNANNNISNEHDIKVSSPINMVNVIDCEANVNCNTSHTSTRSTDVTEFGQLNGDTFTVPQKARQIAFTHKPFTKMTLTENVLKSKNVCHNQRRSENSPEPQYLSQNTAAVQVPSLSQSPSPLPLPESTKENYGSATITDNNDNNNNNNKRKINRSMPTIRKSSSPQRPTLFNRPVKLLRKSVQNINS